MPRDGETPLARFAHAITHERGFSFGAPRLSDNGSLVVLPILRTSNRGRGYVVASEVPHDVSAVDVGRIDRLRIRNDTRSLVFLPPGTLFEGRETASRTLCAGVLLGPGSTCDAAVKCVHAAQVIREGEELVLAPRLAPASVTQSALSRDQGLVWSAAAIFSAAGGAPQGDNSDSLAGDEFLAQVTSLPAPGPTPSETECGVVFLDVDGVVALELYDAPQSWRASVRVRASPDSQAARLALDLSGALRVAKEFVERLPRGAYRPGDGGSGMAADGSAAFTTLDGEMIHLIAFGRDLVRTGSISSHSSAVSSPSPTSEEFLSSFAGGSASVTGPDDADVAVATTADAGTAYGSEDQGPAVPHRRKKVLTSGWDLATFQALERYSRKEFGGDRSAALRSLTRSGLSRRGYFGPQPVQAETVGVLAKEAASPAGDVGLAFAAARVQDLERVAHEDSYAAWLRKRARVELERMADTSPDARLQDLAHSALERLGPVVPMEEAPEPEAELEREEPEKPPAPPPVDVTPLLRRAVMASANAQFPEALSLFDEVLEVEPVNLTALLGRAVALRRAGKSQEALAGLDLVLRLDPENAAAHLNRGRVLQERGDLLGAMEAFDRLASVAPNDWDVWMERGDILARMGRSEEALQSFSEALRRNPDDEKLKRRVEALERVRATEPAVVKVQLPAGLEEGQSFLVKGATPETAYGLFRAMTAQRLPALLITRHPPDQVRKDPTLASVQVAHLYHGTGPEAYSPAALASLSRLIERFVEEHHGHGAILLDGLEMLVANTSFRDALLFVEHVNELVLQRLVVFLIPLTPGRLTERQTALLERNLRVLT